MKKFPFYGLVILMLLAPLLLASPAQAACTGPTGTAGNVVYNTAQKVFQYCDNTVWVGMNKPGTGSGGCSNPTLSEGGMVFNADGRVLQGCAGSTHRAFGPVGGGAEWLKISASPTHSTNPAMAHSCGIKNNGTLWCWGSNSYGELGDGTAVSSSIPVAVPGADFWIDVAAGTTHSCGIKSDGRLFCWGERYGGKIGDGGATTGNQLTPVEVSGGGVWTAVTGGEDSTCGIQANGKAFCWGERSYGRLGVGGATTGNQTTPILVTGEGAWKKITANATHTCGIKTDDTAWCWGYALNGKTGRGNATDASSPVLVFAGADKWLDIDAGFGHTCGIKANGTAWCWGSGTTGKLGNGGTSNSTAAIAVSGGGTWTSIDAAAEHSCGIKTGGALFCWGTNVYGELGDNTVTIRMSPVAVAGGATWKSVSAASYFTCGIKTDGTPWCWGQSASGKLGDNNLRNLLVPTPISDNGAWKTVAAASAHNCGIKSDDTLWCWGSNSSWQLGNNSSSTSLTPTEVSGGGTWKAVAGGTSHSCGIKGDDTLWCWGLNTNGQLGDNTTNPRLVPTAVSGGGGWKAVSVGASHSCGIKSDDTLWCWGNNAGRVGDNTATQRLVPTAVFGGGTWKTLAAGNNHTCGIKTDDTAWCWGINANRQLGDGTNTARSVPTEVSGGGAWNTLAGGGNHSCGIKSDDTLWCWGFNGSGQIGTGAFTVAPTPTAVSGGASWKAVTAGTSHTCGTQTDNSGWCWGMNTSGTIGDGTTTQRLVPTAVTGGGVWKVLSAGGSHNCSVGMGDNRIYCWGANSSLQLTATEFSSPFRPAPTPVKSCSAPLSKPGQIVYDSTRNQLQYCDGAGWVSMAGTAPVPPSFPPPPAEVLGPTSGLIAYWRFDEGSGYIAADSSGNGNPGILSNMADTDWVTGRVGGALDFDGTNDYVWVGSTSILANVFPVTVCAWVYPRTTSATYPIIMDKSGTGQDGWNFYLQANRIKYYSLEGDDQGGAGPAIPMDTWTHACATWDGSAATGANPTGGVMRYMNGVQYSPGEAAFSVTGALSDAAFSLTIGAAVDGTQEFFNGRLDELRIYNRVLSPSEISELYGL